MLNNVKKMFTFIKEFLTTLKQSNLEKPTLKTLNKHVDALFDDDILVHYRVGNNIFLKLTNGNKIFIQKSWRPQLYLDNIKERGVDEEKILQIKEILQYYKFI